jgi:hypothetical protein
VDRKLDRTQNRQLSSRIVSHQLIMAVSWTKDTIDRQTAGGRMARDRSKERKKKINEGKRTETKRRVRSRLQS